MPSPIFVFSESGPEGKGGGSTKKESKEHRVELKEKPYSAAEERDMHHGKPERYEVESDYKNTDQGKGNARKKHSHESALDKGKVKGGRPAHITS